MPKARSDAVIHISLLSTLQLISIAVLLLNVVAFNITSDSVKGLIGTAPGPQDYLLIVLSVLSLLAASLLLCLHLHVFFRLIDNRPYAPSKTILATEMTVGVLLVTLWASATSVVMTNYNVSSYCRNPDSEYVKNFGQACDLLEIAIVLAFLCMALWVFVILAALFTLIQSSIRASATIFTVENLDYSKHSSSMMTLRADHRTHTRQSMASIEKPLIITYPEAAKVHTHSTDLELLSHRINKKEETKSWYSDYATSVTTVEDDDDDEDIMSSVFVPIALDDLPRIQVGMSRMNLSFLAHMS
ncbi:hypothetical protein BX666DRAFT_2031366 [Dichotomocladium elegans]|nr:hypothetical protein BX666DRAFT_2031366 [Dichotomocladium elegans]